MGSFKIPIRGKENRRSRIHSIPHISSPSRETESPKKKFLVKDHPNLSISHHSIQPKKTNGKWRDDLLCPELSETASSSVVKEECA